MLSVAPTRARNEGIRFDFGLIEIRSSPKQIGPGAAATRNDILTIASHLDLTSLYDDDTDERIDRLIEAAIQPIPAASQTVAAICVFPQFLHVAETWVRDKGVRLATVAGDFPSGQAPLVDRAKQVAACTKISDEVDFPIDRRLAFDGNWEQLYFEIKELVSAARGTTTKVILGTGELPNSETIYAAAMVAMMAGADFIKTSTGKEKINATIEAGAVMCRAIMEYERATGYRVGIKPAGGIRETEEALKWLRLVQTQLGDAWITPDLFRIGASSLLEDLRAKSLAGNEAAQ